MGPAWGVIHNQTSNNVVYVLHKKGVHPFNGAIEKYKQKNFSDEKKAEGFITPLQEAALHVPGSRNLPSKSIGLAGLSDINFKMTNAISMVNSMGHLILDDVQISSYTDVKIKLKQNQNKVLIKYLTNQQATLLKKLSSATLKGGSCARCSNSKAKLKELQKKEVIKCKQCTAQVQMVWTCLNYPQAHTFCVDCHNAELMAKAIKEKNINVQ